jgi:hypothetical protein
LLFTKTGLSSAEITSLFVVWTLSSLLLEVPSGVLADVLSRRALLVIGPLLEAAGFALWIAVPSYASFALGFVLWGACGALQSGAIESLVYDGLRHYGAADRYVAISGRAHAVGTVTVLAAMVVASPVFAFGGYGVVGVASVAACLFTSVVALGFPDHRPEETEASENSLDQDKATAFDNSLGHGGEKAEASKDSLGHDQATAFDNSLGSGSEKTESSRDPLDHDGAGAFDNSLGRGGEQTETSRGFLEHGKGRADAPVDPHDDEAGVSEGVGEFLGTLRQGLDLVRGNGRLRHLVLYIAAVVAIWGGLEELVPLLAADSDIPERLIPLLAMGVNAGVALGGVLAGPAARLGQRWLAVGVAVAGGALALGVASGSPWGLVGVVAAFAVFSLAGLVAQARLQDAITGPARATVTSLAGLGTDAANIGVYLLYAAASQYGGDRGGFIGGGLVYVLIGAFAIGRLALTKRSAAQ